MSEDVFGKRYFTVRPCDNDSVALTTKPAGGYEDVGLTYLIAASENVQVNCPNGKPFTVLLVKAIAPGVICLAFHVTTNHNRGKGGQSNCWHTMMLGVSLREGKTIIDLDNAWSPRMGRTGYLDSHQYGGPHEICAAADGVTYTNYASGIANRPNTKLVPDAKLIASYLAGDFVDVEDLDKAATAHTEEVRARELLPQLREELKVEQAERSARGDHLTKLLIAIADAARRDFDKLLTGNVDEVFELYRQSAIKRITSRTIKLDELVGAISSAARQLRLTRWSPWNWGAGRQAAVDVVNTARRLNLLSDDTK